MSIFYMDYELGNDATTATPYGWWSVAFTNGSGVEPVADTTVTEAAPQTDTAKVTRVVTSGGAWAGGTASGTMYFYGYTGTFAAGTCTFPGGTFDIAGDFTYCAWKTITSGATALRIGAGDTIRIAKSPVPTPIGDGTWTGTTLIGGGFPSAISITSSTNPVGFNIQITRNTHGFVDGDVVQIVGHATNTRANGAWVVTAAALNTFELAGSTGNGIGGATGFVQKISSKAVVLDTPNQNLEVTNCEIQWTGANAASATQTSYLTDGKEGGTCSRITAPNPTATGTLYAYLALPATTDFSGYQKITFWVKNTQAVLSTHWTLNLCTNNDGTGVADTFIIPALPAINGWIPLTIARNGGGNCSAGIKSIALISGTVAPVNASVLTFDNIQACTTAGINLQSLISKNSLEQGGTEGWYGIQSINRNVVLLDNGNTMLPNQGRGYSGTSGKVPTYIRETIKTDMVAPGTAGAVQEVQDSGSAVDNMISFLGGYSTATNQQTGETFFDGQNGGGSGIYSVSKNYVALSKLNTCRYYHGIYVYSGTYLTVDLLNSSNNGSIGVYIYTVSNGTFSLQNVNNNTEAIQVYSNSHSNTFSQVGNANNSYNGNGLYIYNSNSNIFNNIDCLDNTNGSGLFLSGSHANRIKMLDSVSYTTMASTYAVSINASHYNYISFNSSVVNCINASSTALRLNGSNNNRIYGMSTNGHAWATQGIYIGAGEADVYLHNCKFLEPLEVNFAAVYPEVSVYLNKNDQTLNNHWVYKDYGTINSVTDANRHTASGVAWKMSPTNVLRRITYPLKMPVAKVAVASGTAVTVKAWIKKTHATDIGAQLVCRGGQIAGITSDVVVTKADDTDYQELTLPAMTPSEAGVIEIEVYAYWAGGVADESVYVDDVTVTQA